MLVSISHAKFSRNDYGLIQPWHRYTLSLALCALIQVSSAEDIIWYQGRSDFEVGHQYGWQGTTDGSTAPQLLIASVINQPWLVAISKSKNIVYWTDSKGVIGAWNANTHRSRFVTQFDIGSWNEKSQGPALTGLDLDELNNHLYFTFNQSIYRLDLNQANSSPLLIATYNTLVFNPRVSVQRNSLFFCLRNASTSGDLVQVSLSDPTKITTLVYNLNGTIVQQFFIDESKNILYYNSPATMTMQGISLNAPYNRIFVSSNLGTNPSFFDYSPKLNMFLFTDMGTRQFGSMYKLQVGASSAPSVVYGAPGGAQVTGVKFFNDTHAIVTYQHDYTRPATGILGVVNFKNPWVSWTDPDALLQNFGMGQSLFFDEKYCNFYYFAEVPHYESSFIENRIMRKNINQDAVLTYYQQNDYEVISGIAFDSNKRNILVAQQGGADGASSIYYHPIDQPDSKQVPVISSLGRSIASFAVNDQTGDIYYTTNSGYEVSRYIFRLDASSVSSDWINNVGRPITKNIYSDGDVCITIDSVNGKLYFSSGQSGPNKAIYRSNLDGSDMKPISDTSRLGVSKSLKWDPSSNRLFQLSTTDQPLGWYLVSMNGDGSNAATTALEVTSSQGTFSQIDPDQQSDWIYVNSNTQPLRIKKDGSSYERLYSYVPFVYLGSSSLAFDESTGLIYYSDVQNTIKKINLNDINKNDPAATDSSLVWKGDAKSFDIQNFIFDKSNQMLWILQNDKNSNGDRHILAVTPVNGGATKPLFQLPNGVHYPWTINVPIKDLYAFSYALDGQGLQTTTLLAMDLYNGSNIRTLKVFTDPVYPKVTPTAMTIDPRTGMLYYALDGEKVTFVECFDPSTMTTKNLMKTDALSVTDIQINNTVLVISPRSRNVQVYDLNTGNVQELNAVASSIALDRKSNVMYFGGGSSRSAPGRGYIRTMSIGDGSVTTLLTSYQLTSITFDLSKRLAYFTASTGDDRTKLPYYYQANLDGTNKRHVQLQNGFYVPSELGQINLFNGKLYSANLNNFPMDSSLDVFNIDGSGYNRIIQQTVVTGPIKYNSALQRVYWQEYSGRRFYNCAVYSNKFADCKGFITFAELTAYKPILFDLVIADNGVAYFIDMSGTIYAMDTNQGSSSLKLFVTDPRMYGSTSIAINKQQTALLILTNSRQVLRVTFDGTISPLYSNIGLSNNLLVTDLSHCK